MYKQQGSSLIISLVLLAIFSLIGIAAMSTSTVEEKMASNSQESLDVFQLTQSELDGQVTYLKSDIKKIYEAVNSTNQKANLNHSLDQAKTTKRGITSNQSELNYEGLSSFSGFGKTNTFSNDINSPKATYLFELNAQLEKTSGSNSNQTYGLSYTGPKQKKFSNK
ncbi:pilus assembly PilX family protein [Spartinivicinus ruber]|uniref:pilus assembly PilX family protein n=1 Tax=Spartinivicinus ruber TaxID=2683272 RepID=UPI0013D0AF77|nr:pilus assembly PilX N-terminal domain-containing protein [Spartinivicinus ruber]